MKAAASAVNPVEKPTPSLDPGDRRKINDSLPPGFAVAVCHPPRKARSAAKPHFVVVKLPRNVGKAPRGGVHIPPPTFAQARLAKVSKHARQKAKDGCFGSKKARLTIAAKLMLMWLASCEAIRQAVERRGKRVLEIIQAGVDAREKRFNETIQTGWGRVFGGRGV